MPVFDVAATRVKNWYQTIGTRYSVLKKYVRRAQKSGGQQGRVSVRIRTGPYLVGISACDGVYLIKILGRKKE